MSATIKWPAFNWEDPFLLEQQLSEEERMVRDTANQYAQDKLAPGVREAFRAESSDIAIFRELGELGLLGPTIEGYGCSGVGYVSYGLAARAVEAVDRLRTKADRYAPACLAGVSGGTSPFPSESLGRGPPRLR